MKRVIFIAVLFFVYVAFVFLFIPISRHYGTRGALALSAIFVVLTFFFMTTTRQKLPNWMHVVISIAGSLTGSCLALHFLP